MQRPVASGARDAVLPVTLTLDEASIRIGVPAELPGGSVAVLPEHPVFSNSIDFTLP